MPRSSTSRHLRWLIPALLILVWVIVGGIAGPYAGKLAEVADNDNATFLPRTAESTLAGQAATEFQPDTVPVVIVWESQTELGEAAVAEAQAQLDEVSEVEGVQGETSPPIRSRDGLALSAFAQIDGDRAGDVEVVVEDIRDVVGKAGTATPYVTGPAGLGADLGTAFSGIDGLLLVAALSVVLLILLIVYRSPILPFAVLLTSVLGLGAAAFVVYQLAKADVIDLDGQAQGIMSILVVGAATDYALLLVARYREELRAVPDRVDAMKVALRQSIGPITASGGTVIAGLLCLLFSDLGSNRSLGPVAALGILGAMISALTFLPALLVLLGRTAFWPFRPRVGTHKPEESGIWGKVGGLVQRRPRRVWVVVTLVLVAMAAFVPTFKADGTSESDFFLNKVESVEGQEALGRHFPGGAGAPTTIVAPESEWTEVVDTVGSIDGVSSAAPVSEDASGGAAPGSGGPSDADAKPLVINDRVLVEVTLSDAADSAAAESTVREVRDRLHAVDDEILVGGPTAQQIDTNDVSAHDRTLIIPILVIVILLVLVVLLRAIVAPLLLVATTVLSFLSTLGVAAVMFNHIFDFPGGNPALPLFAFVFLVALGIDYNIFLMTRVREESVQHGTRKGIVHGLVVTGGVITSAGVVLAATFSVLAVLQILFLAQIAFIVAFGVLLDTFVVRTLLVPALSYDIGSRIWWPSRLQNKR